MDRVSFEIQAATDSALSALMVEHGLLLLGEGPATLAPGVIYSHIGGATLESGGLPLAGRYAFVSVDRDALPDANAKLLALEPHRYKGPSIRYLVGGSNYDPTVNVPQVVTMRQARLALLGAGKLAAVTAALNALPEPQKTAALITWEYSGAVERQNGLVPQLAGALGMTDAQIDALFIAAAAIQ
jgi:hypothetical protein